MGVSRHLGRRLARYVFEPDSARQLSTDDIRDAGDAMANLRQDSVVSNAMSADVDFHLNYRQVELQGPFLIACATDGCFGYVQSPMHFEHMVLANLVRASSAEAWSRQLQQDISAVTGDDAAMSLLGVGADFHELQALFAERVDHLERRCTGPLDGFMRAVEEAERQLEAARCRLVEGSAELWSAYKSGYERYLAPLPATDDTLTGDAPSSDTDAPEAPADPTGLGLVGDRTGTESRSDADPTP
ncbi:MAG: hypothetical protein ACR2JO_04820 [Mycobacteriales bacterium]